MKIVKSYLKLTEGINKVLLWCIGALIGIMAIIICAQVFYRYVLNQSLSWSEELARYMSIWIVFLGCAIAIRKRSMIAIESIVQYLPQNFVAILKTLTSIISFAFCSYLIVQGTNMIDVVAQQKSTALGIPMWIPYLAIPFGAGLMNMNILAVIMEIAFVERRS